MNKKYIVIVINILLAITCVMALGACNEDGDGKIGNNVITQNENDWKASEYSYKIGNWTYSLSMPSYIKYEHDYCDYLQCNYLGKEVNMYVFQLSAKTYVGGGVDESMLESIKVTNCKDAIERSEWILESAIKRSYDDRQKNNYFVDLVYVDSKKVKHDDLVLYKVIAKENDKDLNGYWIYNSSKLSTLILSDNDEMLDKIINELVIKR